jgi:glutaredoxin 3
LLQKKGIPFEEVDLSRDPALRQEIVRRSGRRTVPQIFFDDEPIGGFEELAALAESGQLDERLCAQA